MKTLKGFFLTFALCLWLAGMRCKKKAIVCQEWREHGESMFIGGGGGGSPTQKNFPVGCVK